MATVTFTGATGVYQGSDSPAVDKLNLEIADGEFLVLVGHSGCGKSTSLPMLAGLADVNDGSSHIGRKDVTDVPSQKPRHRDGVPGLRAVPAPDGRLLHGARAEDLRRAEG